MTSDDAALEAEHPRTLDELGKMVAAGVEMLIEMNVQPPSGMLGDLKEKIQEGRRGLRQRRCASHAIGPRGARRGQVPGRRAGEQRDDLEPEAFMPPFAEVDQGLDVAGAQDRIYIGVRAHHDRATGEACLHGPFSARARISA